jgi:hypothetical protein
MAEFTVELWDATPSFAEETLTYVVVVPGSYSLR